MARPRDPRADEAILTATVEVLAEHGFSGLTMDAVAAHAGVGKATIYRRWPSKERMILEALAAKRVHVAEIDTGSLRNDLLSIYANTVAVRGQEITLRLMPALAVEANNDADLRASLQAFIDDRRNPARAAFARAKDRGEVAAEVDVELGIDLVTGLLVNRLLFTGQPVNEAVLADAVDVMLRGIGVAV